MIKKIYYRILRDIAAINFMAALLSSNERYKYISEKIKNGELTNFEATEKNINKSLIMADQFVEKLKTKKD